MCSVYCIHSPAPLHPYHPLADSKTTPVGERGQHTTAPGDPTHYRTSSQMISSVVGALPAANEHHTYGVPTIRCDRPAPRIRRVGDSTVSVCVWGGAYPHCIRHTLSHRPLGVYVCVSPCTMYSRYMCKSNSFIALHVIATHLTTAELW